MRDGVIDLLPRSQVAPSAAQRMMESTAIVRIYESVLWRRSPWIALMMGIGFEDEQAWILKNLALTPWANVLDLACGPGIYTRSIARVVPAGHVVGLDLSIPMLSYATARAKREGVGNIVWVHGDASDLPIADGRLAGVNCGGALHLFPDLQRVLGEVVRVLEPGGRFTCAMAGRVSGARGDRYARFCRRIGIQPRTEEELRGALHDAGLDDVQAQAFRGSWLLASARKGVG